MVGNTRGGPVRSEELRAFLRAQRNRLVLVGRRAPGIHPTSYVHKSARIAKRTVMAEYGFIGPGCQVDPGVVFGRYVMLASQVAIVGDDHRYDVPGTPMQFAGRPRQSKTMISDDVWIGYRAIIRRGVRIGRGAIVGANAVVTKDVAPYELVAGVPAQRIGWRFSEEEQAIHDAMLSGDVVAPSFARPLGVDDPTE